MENKKISIIIPTFNEERYIASCLDSILDTEYDIKQIEVFVVDGMSSDKTRELVQIYHDKYSFIKLLENTQRYTPIAMNLGIKASEGEFIFIISAHAVYESNYFLKLLENIEKLNADCVGSVLVTDVKNKHKKSNAIKEILMHKFGVGNATFRVGSSQIEEVDTVAFGCYNREVFEKYGYYDERLIRNQDIELNKRIINNGGKIYLIPDIKAIYYTRENFKSLAKNNYNNGLWNILTAYYTKTLSSLSLRHFIPLLFIVSLILPTLSALFIPKMIFLSLLSLSSYLALVILISLKLKEKDNNFNYLAISFIVLHFSYGLGSFIGLFSILFKYIKGDK